MCLYELVRGHILQLYIFGFSFSSHYQISFKGSGVGGSQVWCPGVEEWAVADPLREDGGGQGIFSE